MRKVRPPLAMATKRGTLPGRVKALEEKRAVGKPRKQPPADAVAVIKAATARGASKRGCAAALGVHYSVLDRWLSEDEEFREAFEQCRETERQTLHSVLFDCAVGGQGKDSLIAAMFLLKCKFGYREGDQGAEANRVSINFQIPGAMPLSQFQVVENEPNNRAESLPTKFVGRA